MRRRRTRLGWALAPVALLGLTSGVLVAEEAQSDAEEQGASQRAEQARRTLEEPEYVEVNISFVPTSNTIAAKLPVALQLTPANVGAVSGPLFREQDAFTLGEALRNVSSLNVQANAGVHDFFLIRGFDSLSGSLVLTDGAVEPEATYYPLYNVEGIEVLKGPAGFLYGNDPLAGVVNIVRKQPLPVDFTHVGASLGSFSTSEGTLDWNLSDSDGRRGFRLNGLFRDSDGYRDDKSSRHSAVNPSFTLQTGDRGRLTLNLEYVDAEYSPDSGIPLVDNRIPDVPRRRSYQTPFDFSEQAIYRLQADWEAQLGERVTLRNKFYYRDLDWRTRGTQFAGVFPNPGNSRLEVHRFQTSLDDRQRFGGNQFEAIFQLGGGKVSHRLLAGLEVKLLTDDFDIGVVPPESPLTPGVPGIPVLDLFDPVETAAELPAFPFLSGESDSVVVAPYVVDQMQLSQRVQLLLGARYDAISRDDERTAASPPVQERLSRDDDKLSPMLGAVFAPTPDWSFYANASRSYAPAGVRVFGNLEPERSTGYELGAKRRFLDGRVRTTFAAYRIERDNVAIPDDNGVTQQAGDQSSRGFEIELSAEPKPRLRAFLAYAFTDAELDRFAERVVIGFDQMTGQPIEATVDRSGNRPAFVPEHLLSLWVSRSFVGGLGLAGGVRYFSDQYVAEDNVAEIDGALVLDAAVYYDFRRCRVMLNLKNLTDTEYERRGFGATSVIPADPFSVFAGVDVRL